MLPGSELPGSPLPGSPLPGSQATTGPGAPDEVFGLHPLTPVALGGRILGVLVVITLLGLAEHRSSGSGGGGWVQPAIFGGLAVLWVVRGIITVAMTSYHLMGGELRIDSGLLQKQSKRVRLDRVQSVDVLEPLSARIFGLAEVKVTTAGSDRAAVRLRYLAAPVARNLRTDLLGRSAGARRLGGGGAPAAESPERLLTKVPHGQLVASVLLQTLSWRLIFLLIGPALSVVGSQNGHQLTVGLGVALFVSVGLAVVLGVWKQINMFWDFTVADAADGLRVRHGLLSTSGQTVPAGRIQAVLIHQPLTWRPFGWCRLEVDVAGRQRKRRENSAQAGQMRAVLPVGSMPEARWLLS
ncbi:MAG TPA: PH domain-containing protein, partial [Acidimicrobiales bacterium]|nr:PH domain-containing protein [Acidimicrobiales bacterium]